MAWHGPAGQRLYYEDTGSGDTVVLIPGWAGSITDLNDLRQALSTGFRVIAIDLPGSGRSQPQPRRYSAGYYRDDARALLGLLEDLQVAQTHLVGFSDGGEEALLMAALKPRHALSVVTWGAAGTVVASPESLTRLARAVDEPSPDLVTLAAFLVDAYGADNARIMTESWAEAMGQLVAGGGDISRSRASRIRCPTLLVTGTHDSVCPPTLVRELAEAIPRGTFLEAVGAGHDVHRSDPGWLTATVLEWLGAH